MQPKHRIINRLSTRTEQRMMGLAAVATVLAPTTLALASTAAQARTTKPTARAHAAKIISCKPGDRSFTKSLRAQGVSCRQARAIERFRANHDWKPKFRLGGRTWHATASSPTSGHPTRYHFQSGRRNVWLTPSGKGLPIGGNLQHTCSAYLLGGVRYDGMSAAPLQLKSREKASNDDWGAGQPWPRGSYAGWPQPTLYIDASVWGSEAGYFRGCWNTVTYGDGHGSVTVHVSDPWKGGNSESCTTTGDYVCTGPWNTGPYKSTLRGDDLSVVYEVCPTNKLDCVSPTYSEGQTLAH